MPVKPPQLSPADIRDRFAGTEMPHDPLAVTPPPARWPEQWRRLIATELTAAAVLIPVMLHDDELTVLLTERSPDLKHHAGQISFPGGRMDPGDEDIRATALRETHEEVGIRARDVEIVGYLAPNPTVTGYAVTPVIGLVNPRRGLRIDPVEVHSAFEVPLAYLLERANQELAAREFAGVSVPMSEFNYGRHRIWGATAGMLIEFRDYLLK